MSGKALVARPLAPVDREAWESLALRRGCIFDSLRWTDLFGPSLSRLGIYDTGGGLRGGFFVWEQRKFGLKVLRNPPFTPHVGPFYEPRASNPAARTDEQRAVVEAMAEYLSSSGAALLFLGLSLGLTDCLPFYWRGWKVMPRYTYRIDLAQNEDMLQTALSKVRRNDIRKAQKDRVAVEEATDTSEMRVLVLDTFARHDKSFPRTAMDLILSALSPGENSYCLVSRANGRSVAGVYVVHDSRTAYYLMGGYTEGAHHGAGPLAMWHAILKAKALGLEVFDFEGSVVPPIERYIRGFGGQLTPYFGVHKAWLPVEIAMKLRYRRLF